MKRHCVAIIGMGKLAKEACAGLYDKLSPEVQLDVLCMGSGRTKGREILAGFLYDLQDKMTMDALNGQAKQVTFRLADDYADIAEAEMVILAVGKSLAPALKQQMRERYDFVDSSRDPYSVLHYPLVQQICQQLKTHLTKPALVLVITNQADLMAEVAATVLGEAWTVLGAGCLLDSARFSRLATALLAPISGLPVQGYMIGYHHPNMLLLHDSVRVGQLTWGNLEEETQQLLTTAELQAKTEGGHLVALQQDPDLRNINTGVILDAAASHGPGNMLTKTIIAYLGLLEMGQTQPQPLRGCFSTLLTPEAVAIYGAQPHSRLAIPLKISTQKVLPITAYKVTAAEQQQILEAQQQFTQQKLLMAQICQSA